MKQTTQATQKSRFPVLDKSFYVRGDTLEIARELLGKYLITDIGGEGPTGGMITETEAYLGASDKASHAYGGRKTKRNEKLYAEGGNAYVYLCYGMYCLFNAVTGAEGTGDAVLIRAVEPEIGAALMERRRLEKLNGRAGNRSGNLNAAAKIKPEKISSGPGLLTIALGIGLEHNGAPLCGGGGGGGPASNAAGSPEIWLEDRGIAIPEGSVGRTPRIGVGYAQEHALLPWRFKISNPVISDKNNLKL